VLPHVSGSSKYSWEVGTGGGGEEFLQTIAVCRFRRKAGQAITSLLSTYSPSRINLYFLPLTDIIKTSVLDPDPIFWAISIRLILDPERTFA
jgi:hypothetical protein